jgi:proline iminopeptidase
MDPAYMERMARKLPRGRFLLCDEGSHMSMYDDQETYVAGLVEFLMSLRWGPAWR